MNMECEDFKETTQYSLEESAPVICNVVDSRFAFVVVDNLELEARSITYYYYYYYYLLLYLLFYTFIFS